MLEESREKEGVPSISLPKGGGAIRGIGEKFSSSPVTGTGSMSVPIATSPGRAGFGPQLALTYDSGSGNGPFGFGWTLPLPAITRKTDKGLPRYDDARESDVFLLSGAEDLVPVLAGPNWEPETPQVETIAGTEYAVRGYRPRVEGLFARIEQWTSRDGLDTFWRSVSRDNVTTLYGRTPAERIVDPDDGRRVFSWLISETYDDKGNVVRYEYQREDRRGVDVTQPHERNRADSPALANVYLKRVLYGNTPSRLAAAYRGPAGPTWHFELVFDYGEGHHSTVVSTPPNPDGRVFVTASPSANKAWPVRPDPFSMYRAGFEVRTYRRCERVLMFHRFAELGPGPLLVKSTDFAYATDAAYSFLTSVTHSGYVEFDNGFLLQRSLPAVAFAYSPRPSAALLAEVPIADLPAETLENLPAGLGPGYQWIDLDGEGISGVLSEQPGGWYYKRNLGGGLLGPLEHVMARPSVSELGGHQFMDLGADGQLDVVVAEPGFAGFAERTPDESWERFRPLDGAPNESWRDPNVRFIDLTGDGLADLVVSEHDAFVWYRSLGEQGFAAAERVAKALDEERGPHVVFADRTETLFLADMSGDGLTDLVRIRCSDISYWPNLGFGRFGRLITMDRSPRFDHPERFDPARIRLADIDGSGLTDIVYLHPDAPALYFNQSGNGWSNARRLPRVPRVDSLTDVRVVDLLGKGTACLVWSTPLPGETGRQIRYLDLMQGTKPHLLTEVRNNLGGITTLEYDSSTRFYLADRAAGSPWLTRLPFPVHVVTRVTVEDRWRGTRFSSTWSYHHGYFDGEEREFRGFARVEQVDVEAYGRFLAGNADSPWITTDLSLYQPPVKTVTWYHTGAPTDERHVLFQLAREFFPSRFPTQGFRERDLPEPVIEAGLGTPEWREAVRACKGMQLRQEVYELGVDELTAPVPRQRLTRIFSASARTCAVHTIQPRGPNRHAVFLVTESESIDYQYELELGGQNLEPDPRITHTLTLRTNELGNPEQVLVAGYGRRLSRVDADLAVQSLAPADRLAVRQVQAGEMHVAYTETRYTGDAIEPAGVIERVRTTAAAPIVHHRRRVACEVLTHEVTGLAVPADGYLSIESLRQLDLSAAARIPYHALPTRGVPGGDPIELRLVEHVRSLFRRHDDLTTNTPAVALPLGVLGPLGLKYEDYKLALTDGLIDAVFGTRIDDSIGDPALPGLTARDLLDNPTRSGYVRPAAGSSLATLFGVASDNQLWMRSGIAGFASDAGEHFFLAERYVDPFGNPTALEYDGAYDLFLRSTTDALGNVSRVPRYDFRALAPLEMIDPNGNRSEVYFDALFLVVAAAAKGKRVNGRWEGDHLENFTAALANPPLGAVTALCNRTQLDDGDAQVTNWLDTASTRFVYHFGAGNTMPAACGISRETHVGALRGTQRSLHQVELECSDGSGTVLMKKVQAEPAPGQTGLRWLVNGLAIVNNKGKVVKQYEPAFSTIGFGPEQPQANGVATVMYYDAAGRLVRTESPDGAFTRVEFTPWHTSSYDANDTVMQSLWYTRRGSPSPANALATGASAETRAAWLAARHANTPAVSFLDSLGREVITVAHNRTAAPPPATGIRDEQYVTRVRIDAEGKPLWIRDARGNLVVQYVTPPAPNNPPTDPTAGYAPGYDLAGNLLFQHSMDSGDRWTLVDAAGKPMLGWDDNQWVDANDTARDVERRLSFTEYDALHRPVNHWLSVNGQARQLVSATIYGESLPAADAALRNLRGQATRIFDPSGLNQVDRLDFKGNTLEVRRRLTNQYRSRVLDWKVTDRDALLEAETYARIGTYDALNRSTLTYNWHRDAAGSRVAVYRPRYNRRGLPAGESIEVGALKTAAGHDPSANPAVDAVAEIRYNAKGQKVYLRLGNQTVTQYDYDPETWRLRELRTTRAGFSPAFPEAGGSLRDARVLQNLHYVYDPVGNVTEIRDDAFAPAFFRNQQVDPVSTFTYDALYRLIAATGREFVQANAAPERFEAVVPEVQFPLTSTTLRDYSQEYEYDAVGNIGVMRHVATGGQWTRRYRYAADSNRLDRTWLGNAVNAATVYRHDAHGNMLNLANVLEAQYQRWDYRDMISALFLQGGGWAYYHYDSGKQRTRKRLERNGGTIEDRIYLGGLEISRKYQGGALVERIESHHVFLADQRVLQVDDIQVTNSTRYTVGVKNRYQYSNHVGSACLELDGTAGIISYEEYHPYGTSAYRATNDAIEVPPKRYRYTGMERDEESGLSYHTARYYAAWLSRWISCDPQGLKDGPNVYRYASATPAMLRDAEGTNGKVTEAMISSRVQAFLQKYGWAYQAEVRIRVNVGGVEVTTIADFYAHPPGQPGKLWHLEVKIDDPALPNARSSYTFNQELTTPEIQKGKTFFPEQNYSNVSMPADQPAKASEYRMIDEARVDEFGKELERNTELPDKPYKPADKRTRSPSGEIIKTPIKDTPVGSLKSLIPPPEPGAPGIKGGQSGQATISAALEMPNRILLLYSLWQTTLSLHQAAQQSKLEGTSKAFEDEVIRQSGAWGFGIAGSMAIGWAVDAAIAGSTLGPWGTAGGFVLGLAGGAAFSYFGYKAGDSLVQSDPNRTPISEQFKALINGPLQYLELLQMSGRPLFGR